MPPVSEVSIRCSTPCDVTMLREILHDTYRNTWLPELSAEAAQMFRNEDRPAIYVEKRGAEFWVAELEGKVVGFVDWEGDFVNALHVRTEKARTGIGRHLMDFAEAEIAKMASRPHDWKPTLSMLGRAHFMRLAAIARRNNILTPNGTAG